MVISLRKKIDYLPINVMSLTHKAMLESAYKFRNFPLTSIKLSYMGVFREHRNAGQEKS